MKNLITNRIILIFIIVQITMVFSSCTIHTNEERLAEIKRKAESINKDFKTIRNEVETLAFSIKDLYVHQNTILPSINTNKYQLLNDGIYYKPIDDGGSAVFVSGFYKVNDEIKRIVHFTEPIEVNFKNLVKNYSEIAQVYYNDKHSYNRIYPYFDVLSQYEAKIEIPAFNFYYLADTYHNPQRQSLWVNEPYVDPAGRGWLVSSIAPVYFKDKLVGVTGIDVTIQTIAHRYLDNNPSSLQMIIDHTSGIVTSQESTINLLSFPPLNDHKYIETIKQDTYRKEQYSLSHSKDTKIQVLAYQIIKNKKELIETEINGEKYIVFAAHIPELNWYLIEMIKQ